MKILITGSYGQLGSELRQILQQYADIQAFFTDVDTLDICNCDEVVRFFAENQPDFVINCAAYTAVDKAESEEDIAYKINATAVKNLAETALKYNLFLIHISTDYVFDGNHTQPYRTEDCPHPISAYGRTKLAGERYILDLDIRAAIIRTSWLYSSYGNNFVKTMLRLGGERNEISVVSDQFGAPTYAADLAYACLKIIAQSKKITQPEIFHYANTGVISWADFAAKIMESANLNCTVKYIKTSDYPTAAVRPKYSVFDLSKIKNMFNLDIPDWEISLKRCLCSFSLEKTDFCLSKLS